MIPVVHLAQLGQPAGDGFLTVFAIAVSVCCCSSNAFARRRV